MRRLVIAHCCHTFNTINKNTEALWVGSKEIGVGVNNDNKTKYIVMSRGVTYSTGTIGGVLHTGQGLLAGCYEQYRDHWRGVKNRTVPSGGVLRTGQGPLVGYYEPDRVQWRGVTNRIGTIGGVLRTGQWTYGFHKRPRVSVLILRNVFWGVVGVRPFTFRVPTHKFVPRCGLCNENLAYPLSLSHGFQYFGCIMC
jgi:hypothetical protein